MKKKARRLTFPVIVPVDMEGVEQLVVVMGEKVHRSGTGLDDADHLQAGCE